MINLYDFLYSRLILEAGGFVNLLQTNDIGDFLQKNYNLTDEISDYIQSEFENLFKIANKEGIQCRIVYDTSKKYVKIPYELIPVILNYFDEDSNSDKLYYKEDSSNDKKIYIYYKNHKLAETGRGNYGSKSLDKEIHENLTSIYFNTKEDKWDVLDARIKELYNYANLNIWIPSFHEQVKAIKSKFKGKYRAVRIDNETNISAIYNEVFNGLNDDFGWDCKLSANDIKVNQSYNKLSISQKQWIIKDNGATKLRREAYDKSDIIIYDENKISDIIKASKIDSTNAEELVDVKSDMVKLYNNKCLIGISLKGLSTANGKFDMVEFNTEQSPENGVINKITKYNVLNILRTKKNTYNIQNGFTINITTKNSEELELNLRSFGNNAALEVKYSKKPPLGKSPIFLWRKFVQENIGKSPIGKANSTTIKSIFTGKYYNELAEKFGWDKIDDNVEFSFESTNISTVIGLQFLYSLSKLSDKEIIEQLEVWTKAAIAEADYAFPFVLTEEK